MYEFARGPLVWAAFLVFVLGSVYRVVHTIRKARKEKVVLPYISVKYALRSILHWIVPFGSKNMRLRPVFTLLSFVFHMCLIATPLFLVGHSLSWKQSWGVRIWSLPEPLTNAMTVAVIAVGTFLFLRRLLSPTVRYVSEWGDFLLLLLVLSPFVTGLCAYYQLFDYRAAITAHIWTGALWLMAIPFTRISHMLYFPLTRAYMGCEFGLVRHARDW